jgi:hypothetical protein
LEAHGTGAQYAYDRVKQALHLHTDRGSALREAAMACRKAGTLAVVGVYGVIDKFPLGVVMNKGLTIRTAQQPGQRYMPRMLEHVQKGELDPSFLITHRMSLLRRIQATLFHHGVGGTPGTAANGRRRAFLERLPLPADARADRDRAGDDRRDRGADRPLERELRQLARRQTGA